MKFVCRIKNLLHSQERLQRGQAIIYVILLGASVLGAALVANQNILVDILRTKRLQAATAAYYVAEGALEESLLAIKEKGYLVEDKDIALSRIEGQSSSVDYAPVAKHASEIKSSDLLQDGILHKDQSLNITIPEEWKNGDSYKIQIDIPSDGLIEKYKDAQGNDVYYDSNKLNRALEVRAFGNGETRWVGFTRSADLQEPGNNEYIIFKKFNTLQIKPYGMDITNFTIKKKDYSGYFTSLSKKKLNVQGGYLGSSREINVEINENDLKPLPLFDFGLFSQQKTNLNP